MKSPSRQAAQMPQWPPNQPTAARSPATQPSTPSPSASIRPAISCPHTRGNGTSGKAALTKAASEPHTPHASTVRRTWPRARSGRSRSTMLNAPPGSATWADRIVVMALPRCLGEFDGSELRVSMRGRGRGRPCRACAVAAIGISSVPSATRPTRVSSVSRLATSICPWALMPRRSTEVWQQTLEAQLVRVVICADRLDPRFEQILDARPDGRRGVRGCALRRGDPCLRRRDPRRLPGRPVRSLVMSIAHRRTRECLRQERCDPLATA